MVVTVAYPYLHGADSILLLPTRRWHYPTLTYMAETVAYPYLYDGDYSLPYLHGGYCKLLYLRRDCRLSQPTWW